MVNIKHDIKHATSIVGFHENAKKLGHLLTGHNLPYFILYFYVVYYILYICSYSSIFESWRTNNVFNVVISDAFTLLNTLLPTIAVFVIAWAISHGMKTTPFIAAIAPGVGVLATFIIVHIIMRILKMNGAASGSPSKVHFAEATAGTLYRITESYTIQSSFQFLWALVLASLITVA